MSNQTIPRTGVFFVILLVSVLASGASSAAEHPLKRQVVAKQVYAELPENADVDHIVFKLRESANRPRLQNGSFEGPGYQLQSLNDIIATTGGVETVRRRLSIDIAELDQMREEGSRRIGWQLPDLSLYYEIQLSSGALSQDRLEVINRLNELNMVEIAYFAPRIMMPEMSEDASFAAEMDEGETPNWEANQYYLWPAPRGLNAYYGWSFPGGRGENVKVIDLEKNWNQTHEDLHGGIDDFHIAGDRVDDPSHGTAVLGILAADSNSFGVTGIAHNVDLGTVAVAEYAGVANEIMIASANAEIGDLILIEFSVPGGLDGDLAVPAEWIQENFDAILTVSALGQVVVEPVGNMSYDLDDTELFDSLFYPEYRYSGAIAVGAADMMHVPAIRSSYGQRVDVHACGCYDVYTLGFASLYGTELNNEYTHQFSGTSAAGPQIAGACAILQSIYKERTGSTLDHNELRSLLTTYSTPQVDHYKHIGPMPDLAGSCEALTGFASPDQPCPVSPDNGTYFESPAQVMLDWEDVQGAMSYQVQIGADFSFVEPLYGLQGLTISEVMSPELTTGKYNWRVRAFNADRFGPWSDIRGVLVGLQPEAPVLISPEDGETLSPRAIPNYEWFCVNGTDGYILQMDTKPDFSPAARSVLFFNSVDGVCETWQHVPAKTVYWRVKGIDEGWPWSEVRSLRTRGYKPELKPDGGSERTASFGNYPNPFNPTTQIFFNLPEACRARLEIFNILGQKVATLLDKNVSAGDHTVDWNASGSPSGVYFYRLSAGDEVMSKKMVLVR